MARSWRSRPGALRALVLSACCACVAANELSAQDRAEAPTLQDESSTSHTSTLVAPAVLPTPQEPAVPRALEMSPLTVIGGKNWRLSADSTGGRCCILDPLYFWQTVGMSPKGPSSFRSMLDIGNRRTSVAVGVVGRRDYRLPLIMSTTFGGGDVPTPALMSLTDMSAANVTWQAIGSVRRELFTTKRGRTIGLVSDAILPFGTQINRVLPNNPTIAGRGVRFGVTFGF